MESKITTTEIIKVLLFEFRISNQHRIAMIFDVATQVFFQIFKHHPATNDYFIKVHWRITDEWIFYVLPLIENQDDNEMKVIATDVWKPTVSTRAIKPYIKQYTISNSIYYMKTET